MKPLFRTIPMLITSCIKEHPCGREKEGQTVKFEVADYLPDELHNFDNLTPRSISLSFYMSNNSEVIIKKLNAEKGRYILKRENTPS